MKLIAGLMLLALMSLSGQVQEGLHFKFGTWKLNLQKSKFPPGTPAPRSDTRVYEDRGGGVIMSTHTTVSQQGQEALTIYAAKFDGKEYPVATRGSGALSTIAFQVIDPYSESFVLTRDGKGRRPRHHYCFEGRQDANNDVEHHQRRGTNIARNQHL